MISQQLLTQHQSQYYAWLLTRRAAGDTVESLAFTLVDAQLDLNPHQVEAAFFVCNNPLSRGVMASMRKDKRSWQKQQRELEAKLQQQIDEKTIFTIEWKFQ